VQPTTKDKFGLKPASHKDSLTWLNGETDWKVAPLRAHLSKLFTCGFEICVRSSWGFPPADGPTTSMRRASTWKGAPVRTRTPTLPNLPNPSLTRLGLRPAVPAALIGTGPESGAVPRGRPCQWAIWLRLSRERDRLPDRVCRALLVRHTTANPGDGRSRHRQHDCPPLGMAACLPACPVACLPGWSSDPMPVCMCARLPVGQSACLCPSPDR
jgi:hypothetical protein